MVPRDASDDPGALFSVPGQLGAATEDKSITDEPKKKAPAKRKRLSREVTKNPETLPVGWSVSADMEAWAKEKAPDVISRIATERFITYFGDGGKRKKDWDLTWRNWLLSDQQRHAERAQAANGSGYASNGTGAHNRQGSTYHHIPDTRAPGRNYKERL
ncbi:hypothetical protein [Paractinoplanes maris]|uniref:hypothetical protein n=1 Tax=Paractinoplanes maris TaxID=1734446 RepID=UPI002020BCD6|nr:hypothetical protein [Actinoplanes maris]